MAPSSQELEPPGIPARFSAHAPVFLLGDGGTFVSLVYGCQDGPTSSGLIHAHLVFTTKRRGKVLVPERLSRLRAIFASVCAAFEVDLREF